MLWGHPPPTGPPARTCSPAEPISIHGAGGSASNEKGAHHWGQGGSAGGDAARQAPSLGPKTRWRWLLLSNRTPKAFVGKSRRGEAARDYARGRRSVRRGKESPVRNLRRPRPLTLLLPLHDCGAAADLPGGRPRKPAGVSSAARARPTSKPRLSASPPQAVRARRRCGRGRRGGRGGRGGGVRERGPSLGGAWGKCGGRALPRSSAGPCLPETTRRSWTLSTTQAWGGACLRRRRRGRCSLPGEEPTWSVAGLWCGARTYSGVTRAEQV